MRLIGKLSAALLLLSTGAHAHTHTVPPESIDAARLSDTSVTVLDVTQANGVGKSFIAGTVIDAPMKKLCSIIQDFPGYPDFMPNMSQTRVVRTEGTASVVDMTLKLPLGKIKKYRLRMEPAVGEQTCRRSWRLVPWEGLKPEETIVDTTGYWHLAPSASDRNKTVVKYSSTPIRAPCLSASDG